MKSNKKFIEIMAGDMESAPLSVKVNIAGKQKYLSQMVGKLTNIFRQIMASPQILQNKGMANLFNQIIESSGLSPIDFSGIGEIALPQRPQQNLTAGSPDTGLPA